MAKLLHVEMLPKLELELEIELPSVRLYPRFSPGSLTTIFGCGETHESGSWAKPLSAAARGLRVSAGRATAKLWVGGYHIQNSWR